MRSVMHCSIIENSFIALESLLSFIYLTLPRTLFVLFNNISWRSLHSRVDLYSSFLFTTVYYSLVEMYPCFCNQSLNDIQFGSFQSFVITNGPTVN